MANIAQSTGFGIPIAQRPRPTGTAYGTLTTSCMRVMSDASHRIIERFSRPLQLGRSCKTNHSIAQILAPQEHEDHGDDSYATGS